MLSVGCFRSFLLEELWDGEQEEAAGADASAVEDGLGSAAGEDGGEV